jgi:calcineurin-like phosphoesterase family protein
MDEVISARHNAVVHPSDTVYMLGDLVMGDFEAGIKRVATLDGRKILIPGNHDRMFSKHRTAYVDKWQPFYEAAGFEVLPREVDFHQDGSSSPLFHMCHFPYRGDSHGSDRYGDLRPIDNGGWLVHGHVHDEWKVREKQINVGVDVWNCTPVSLEQIKDIMAAD